MDNKKAAAELIAELKAKAEELETLNEAQLEELRQGANKENGGCWLVTPCVVVECFVVSPT